MKSSTVERFTPRYGRGVDNGLMARLNRRDFARRLDNPTFPGGVEVINQPVFDTVTFAAAAAFTKTTLFQAPIGQAGKTLAQTNMVQAGQLPAPQKLTVRAIRFVVSNTTTPTDLVNIATNVSFVLNVGKKPMLEVPCAVLSAGCGVQVVAAGQLGTAAAGDGQIFSTSFGSLDQRSLFTLNVPFTIEQGETFNVVLNPETAFNFAAAGAKPAGVGATISVFLEGELYRAIQ